MIVIIDYKSGNVGSILNMVKYLGGQAIISSDPEIIKNASKLILPGVGSFDNGMKNLSNYDLVDVIKQKALVEKVHVMGICLGAQLMTIGSEEGLESGLGLFDANTRKFNFGNALLKVPHMGWNSTKIVKSSTIIENLPIDSKFYFVHKYYMTGLAEDVLLSATYDQVFHAALQKDNIFAFQFHPEKSHKYGMQIFNNFIKL